MTGDNYHAPRRCLKEPIPEIFEAASRLSEAVDAHLAGDRGRADHLIREADMPPIGDWVLPLLGSDQQFPGRAADVRFRQVSGAPATLPKADRIPARMPTAAQKADLIALYGYNCAFCGIPLVTAEVRKALTVAYPEAAYWSATGACHAALLCMWLQFDHVLPHSRGGDNSLSNILVTCSGCNYGRTSVGIAYTLEEVGLLDPRLTPPTRTDWDGLQRLLRSS